MNSRLAGRLSCALFCAVLCFCLTADAQTWTGNTSGNWNIASNWSSNPSLPASSGETALTFGAPGPGGTLLTQNIASPFDLNMLTFTSAAPSYVIGGNALQFQVTSIGVPPKLVQNSSQPITFNVPISFFNIATISGVGGGQLNFNGAISGSGGLTISSGGTVVLGNGANTFTFNPTVNNGSLVLGIGTAIPAGRNIVLNGSNSYFNTNGLSNTPATAIGTLTLNTATFRIPSGSGNYYLTRINNTTSGSQLVDFTGSTNSTLHFVNAGGGVNINGAATWVGAGTSSIVNDTASPLDVTLGGGVLTSSVHLANGASGQGFRFLGPGGIVNLTNPGNTANLIFDNNAYATVTDMAFLGSGSFTLAGGGTLPGTLHYTSASPASSSKAISLGSGGGQIWVDQTGANLTLSGIISETVAGQRLLVAGNFATPPGSTLTLSANNTYTGPTIIGYGGILSVNSIPNGGVVGPLGASTNAPANLVISGHPSGGAGTLRYTGATTTTNRGVTLGAVSIDSTIEVTNAAANLTFSGQFTGPGNLLKTGAGTLTLSNATNNFTGGARVDAGRLTIGSAGAIPAGSDVTINSGAEFNTGGFPISGASALDIITFNGGTLRAQSSGLTTVGVHQLIFGPSGGAIDATGSTGNGGILLTNNPGYIEARHDVTWSGPNTSYVGNSTNAEARIYIYTGNTITSSLSLSSYTSPTDNPFSIEGGGRLYLTNPVFYTAGVSVSGAILRMDDLTAVSPTTAFALTLDNGTLEYGGPTAFATGLGLAGFGGTINILNAATTLTMSQIPSSGPFSTALTKAGPGTLILSSASNGFAAVNVDAGRLRLGSASAIPADGDATVQNGAELHIGGFSNSSAILDTLTLNGGTLRGFSGGTNYYLKQLTTNTAGGTIDTTPAADAVLRFSGATPSITINGNSTWGPTGAIAKDNFRELLINIAPNVTLTSGLRLAAPIGGDDSPYHVLGGGTLYLTNPAAGFGAPIQLLVEDSRIRLDDASTLGSVALVLTLDNGTLQYGGASASSSSSGFKLTARGGTVEVLNPATTLTFNGAITGSGPLTKSGPGTLVLGTTTSSYTGGIVVSNGRLEVPADTNLGGAAVTVNPLGTLRYTNNATTARTFNLLGGTLEIAAGRALTLNGATVGGGFMRGPTFQLQGNTILSGTNISIATNVNQSGPASIISSTNNGQITNSAGQTLTLTNSTNSSSGRLIIDGTANVSEFLSTGQITVNPGGNLLNSGSPLYLGGGSTTYIGSPTTPGGAINLGAQTLELRGGLLSNNGTISNGTVNVRFGALAKGAGTYPAIFIDDGGRFSPGNSPGTVTTGSTTWNAGGSYVVEIAELSSDFWQVDGLLNLNESVNHPFTISLASMDGLIFDPTRDYTWPILHATAINGFTSGSLILDTTAFKPNLSGGHFSLASTATDLSVHFSPIPEPSTIFVFLGLSLLRWRRRR